MKSYTSSEFARKACVKTGAAKWILPVAGRKPISIFANDTIFAGFDDKVFEQAVNTAEAPGVDSVMILPDSHAGYGCPVGSVVITDNMVYPGPVGPDKGCSMSLLQTDLDDAAIEDKKTRRAIIDAIGQRIPTGAGSRQAPKARKISTNILEEITIMGAFPEILEQLDIPLSWGNNLESNSYGNSWELSERISVIDQRIIEKLVQIGSYGGGNHMGEMETVSICPGMEKTAAHFGLLDKKIGFLSHCGSRGFGFQLAALHFKGLEKKFHDWAIPFPGNEKELVYAPLNSKEGQTYMAHMALAVNFAIVNHLLINALVLEAIQEVVPGTKGDLVYHIAHNVGREEIVDGQKRLVFRKGTTRAYPAGHHSLKDTRYYETGHPILLPGNPQAGSYVMVGLEGAKDSAYSINHGAGRAMGRKQAKRTLDQNQVNQTFADNDIMFNGRNYPIDESPAAYKDFEQVTDSVEQAGLAKRVAHLKARFVIKDNDQSAEGAA